MAFLVTGSSGCIGAWTVAILHGLGVPVVGADVSDDHRRLRYLLSDAEIDRVRFEQVDVTSLESVTRVTAAAGITNIVHLAGLQVPFCRADPVLGAQVNVVGTATILEAARRSDGKVKGVSYASSLAVYGPPELYPNARVDDGSPLAPATLYGIYKQADEGIALRYAADYGLGSVGLRPTIVYGPGRDQGLTSDPTKAMLAVAAGGPGHIGFGGRSVLHHAEDVANAFISAAQIEGADGRALNVPGSEVALDQVAQAIRNFVPGAEVTVDSTPLPFPEGVDSSSFVRLVGAEIRPLDQGVADSIEHFRRLLAEGLIEPS
ncbi:MAG TPA: NAD-dependent epimerase/dehydratase family protein [Acidimicrobiia bacterium]|nr:NAD-dependent epimerase/dehydratase family protein [Acidimicrobiia bacterium]